MEHKHPFRQYEINRRDQKLYMDYPYNAAFKSFSHVVYLLDLSDVFTSWSSNRPDKEIEVIGHYMDGVAVIGRDKLP